METYLKSALHYSYNWSVYADDDPRISGLPDDTPFNRQEGEEVLYLIHLLSDHLAYSVESFGERMERMIRQDLPETITTQAEALHWIKAHWRSAARKKAARSIRKGDGGHRRSDLAA